jgi:hypothetical protein
MEDDSCEPLHVPCMITGTMVADTTYGTTCAPCVT